MIYRTAWSLALAAFFIPLLAVSLMGQQGSPTGTMDRRETPVRAATPELSDAAQVMALEEKIEEDVIRGNAGEIDTATSTDFTVVHGANWTTGGRPLEADDKTAFLKRVEGREYLIHDLDDVKFEMHGDVAVSYGRYVSLNQAEARTANAPAQLHSVWFERVYAKRSGQWVYLSDRTVNGPTVSRAGIDPTSLAADGGPAGGPSVASNDNPPQVPNGGARSRGVPEASDPTVNLSLAAAEVLAFEKEVEDAIVRRDLDFVSAALASDFVEVSGDAWVRGGTAAPVDDKAGFLRQVRTGHWATRDLDSVKVEMHGDVAITYGRYIAKSADAFDSHPWLSAWFERVYAKRDGKWYRLSDRIVHGPTYGTDRASLGDR